jgi:pimeloyl-ACP methyl ester carboxylesterase
LRSRFVDAGGIRTHYTEAGDDGPVILALHGGGPGASGEAAFGSLALELASEFRIIALDSVGGYGLTDPDTPQMPDGLMGRVYHCEAFADALCLERFTVLGNSHGAWCAAKYAALHPDRIERIALIASGSVTQSMGLEENRSAGLMTLINYDWTRDGMRAVLQGLVANHDRVTDALIDMRFATASRPGMRAAYERMLKGTRRLRDDPLLRLLFDMRGVLPALTKQIPTIMIWGENDSMAAPELGRRLAQLLPDVVFHWVPDAGHQVQTDQPEVVGEIIRAFAAVATV